MPGFYNNGWEDRSGTGQCLIWNSAHLPYTPSIFSAGREVDHGDARLSGLFNRAGNKIAFNITFSPGSATRLPQSGAVSISLPFGSYDVPVQTGVTGRLLTSDGRLYRLAGYILAREQVVHLERDGTGPITNGAPGPLGRGRRYAGDRRISYLTQRGRARRWSR